MILRTLSPRGDFFSPGKIIFFIVLLGLAIRLTSVSYGLPYLYYADEPSVVEAAKKFLVSGDLNPRWFYWPGPPLMYLLSLIYLFRAAPFHAVQILKTGAFQDIHFLGALPDTPVFYYFSGRVAMCLFGAASIYLLYDVCRKVFNARIACLAAGVFALAPIHVVHSAIIRPDVPAAALILLALNFLYRFSKNEEKIFLNAAAFFAGIATAVKYPSALILIPVLIQGAKASRPRGIFQIFIFAFLGFFLTSPFVVLDLRTAFQQVVFEISQKDLGHDGVPGIENFLWYLNTSFCRGIGGRTIEVIAGLGLCRMLRERKYSHLLFLSFPLSTLALLSLSISRMDRWGIPVLPFEAALFGAGLDMGYEYLQKRFRHLNSKLCPLILTTAFLVLTAPVAAQDIQTAQLLSRTDNRLAAEQWIETNLPAGSKIAYEAYSLTGHIESFGKFSLVKMGWAGIVSKPLSYYKKLGVNYIVTSNSYKDRYYINRKKYPLEISRYEIMDSETEKIRLFNSRGNPGPYIGIYKIR